MSATPVITKTYNVAGMTCGHCEASVREEISEISSVRDVTADHTTGVVTVTVSAEHEPDTSVTTLAALDEQVAAAVSEAGYRVV